MTDDVSRVVGPGRPDAEAIFAALRSQIDPTTLSGAERQAIEIAARDGDRSAALKILRAAGADPGRFGWTEIFLAVALGTLADLEEAVTGPSPLEAVDGAARTAFLLAVQCGAIDKAKLLLAAGADRFAMGDLGETALSYAIAEDDVPMMEWLFEQGFDAHSETAEGETALATAAACGAVRCLTALLKAGATVHGAGPLAPLRVASDRQVIRLLVEAGGDPQALDAEQRACLLGHAIDTPPACSLDDYRQYRSRDFGRANPERIDNPFWNAMVRCGGSALHAERTFAEESRRLRKARTPAPAAEAKTGWKDPRAAARPDTRFSGGYPIWCHRRFGATINRLADGRFVEIAGEHEDFYDPNFCIYNDVIVQDGEGGFDIYAYPREIFPPTDFHSATLVGDALYIIGNLGYGPDRQPGVTPVYRLDIPSFRIDAVETFGDRPGWIHGHQARRDGDTRIVVSGGRCAVRETDALDLVDNRGVFALDLTRMTWSRIS